MNLWLRKNWWLAKNWWSVTHWMLPRGVSFLLLMGEMAQGLSAARPDWQRLMVVKHCQIFRYDGRLIKTFPGAYCVFLDDGRFVSGSTDRLEMFDKNTKQLWKLEGHFHHQLNLSIDGQSLLTLSSEFSKLSGQEIRYDVVLRIGLDGKILSKHRSDSLFREVGLPFETVPFNWVRDIVQKAPNLLEHSHFNSVYEIPQNVYSTKYPALAEGSVVVNSTGRGVILIPKDPKVPKVVYQLPHSANAHDVQVTKQGQFLYFSNEKLSSSGLNAQGPYSSVETFDPISKKEQVLFRAEPKQAFFSAYCGGVQGLSDNLLLISHMSLGYFIYDYQRKKLEYANPTIGMPAPPAALSVTQQYRALDLSKFLAAWGVASAEIWPEDKKQ